MPSALLALVLSYTAVSPRAAVATAHPLASQAAAEILRAGGNAADAAAAAAYALSVVENERSGLGGGGFALVWLEREKRVHVLDFREVAPAGARRDMFLRGGKPDPALSRQGGLAVGVPGAAKGYAELARRFGRLPLARLVEPAARIAERGFPVGERYADAARESLACLRSDPAAAREFLVPGPGGERVPLAPGSRLVRRDLARTLRALGRRPEAPYRGPLADRVAAAARAAGGVLAPADLAAYRVREREPLWGSYRGRRIASMPLPSAGGAIVLGLLQALEGDDPRAGGFRDPAFLHAFVEVERRLFARRAALGDPAFAPGAEAAALEMIDPAIDRALRDEVGERAAPSPGPAPGGARPGGGTSHLSVVDGEGNAVALTTTVNRYFGACLVVPGTGILLNDQMDDFEPAPGEPNAWGLRGSGANAVEPGKVPLSSMAPTLVFDPSGRVLLALGASGGSTIPSTVAQVILRVLGDGMPLDQALAFPRIHCQGPADEVVVEPFGLDGATARALEARGHALRFLARWPFGNPQAVLVDPSTGLREAASDPRLEGVPAAF
jgi:gamma-glutamyltranspeptidase/glutathione hydrolase